jgi:hypothetical protein
LTSWNMIRMVKSRRMRCMGHVTCMGQVRNAYKIVGGKPEGKTPLRRPRCRWEDSFKMDLGVISYKVQFRFMWLGIGTCEHGNEPSCATKCVQFLD